MQIKIKHIIKITTFIVALTVCSVINAQNSDTLLLSMDSAVSIALNDNPTIVIAGKNIAVQKQANAAAWEQMFSLSGSGQYSRSFIKQRLYMTLPNMPANPEGFEMGYDNSINFSVTASLALVSPALWKNIQISKTDIEIATEALRASKITLRNEVKKAYYAAMLAEDAYDVLQQSYDVALRAYQNIEKMYEQGLVAEYDKIRADVSVKNIKPQLTQMQNSVELTKMMLKVLLSLPVDMQIKIDGSLADMEGAMMSEILLSRFDLSENSDLLTLDLNLKKLQQQKALINTQRMPTLAAFSQFTPATQANDNAFDDARWNYPLAAGLQLQVPLWDIYAKQRQVNQVKIGIEQIKIQKDYLKQNLSVQAQNSVNKMLQAKEQLESNKEAVTQAQKGLDISQVRYDTGVGTILELNDAQMALVQSKLNYTQAIYDFLISKFELEKLLGNI